MYLCRLLNKEEGKRVTLLFLNITTFDLCRGVESIFSGYFIETCIFRRIFLATRNGPMDTSRKKKKNRNRSSLLYNYGSFYGGDDDEVQHIKIALFSFIAFVTVCSTVCYMK